LREIAAAQGFCGHGRDVSQSLIDMGAPVVGEEECPWILSRAHRPAEGRAELIHAKDGLEFVEEVAGVEIRVAEKLKRAAVVLRGSRLDDEIVPPP
jgi:hypothetical protein